MKNIDFNNWDLLDKENVKNRKKYKIKLKVLIGIIFYIINLIFIFQYMEYSKVSSLFGFFIFLDILFTIIISLYNIIFNKWTIKFFLYMKKLLNKEINI